MSTEYATMDDFCLADARRIHSPEADYGVHWRDGGRPWPQWRVSYIKDTGEVYAVRLHGSPLGPVRVLGVVPADPTPRSDASRTVPWNEAEFYRTLDGILVGWADPDVSGFDLAWVRGRLARRAGNVLPARHAQQEG